MDPSFRKLGFGQLLYQAYYRPLEWLHAMRAAGGLREQRRTEQGRRDMEQAARTLPLLPQSTGSSLELHLLSGNRFWFQTAFCLWTFGVNAQRPLSPVIYDDGTLDAAHREPLTRLFPAIRFIAREESVSRLDHDLPASRFPFLRERWLNYPNLRKLTDPHVGSTGWKLVLDSDLLFFRRPEFLLHWLDAPVLPLHAVDCETSYGYSRSLMTELAGTAVLDLINVGLTGLNSSELDWEKLEYWCRGLITRERTNYYLEQALVAMLVGPRDCAIAPAADYVTLPIAPEANECHAVMHHYVANSKKWYFQHNWRRVGVAKQTA